MQLYEAHGELMAVTTKKTKLPVNKRTTYEEYVAMPAARDVEATVPLNLSNAITGGSEDKVAQAFADRSEASKAEASTSTSGTQGPAATEKEATSSRFSFTSMGLSSKNRKGGSTHTPDRNVRASSQSGSEAADGTGRSDPVKVQVAGTGRTVRARMWLTQDSPINQKQLLPLLDIVGSTNQYIIKVLHLTMLCCAMHAAVCVTSRVHAGLHFHGEVRQPAVVSSQSTGAVDNVAACNIACEEYTVVGWQGKRICCSQRHRSAEGTARY